MRLWAFFLGVFILPFALFGVDYIAHRGNSSESPENTRASFKQALELGADFIELDVFLTKDSVPVVIHDDNLSRLTNGKSNAQVKDLTFEEIQKLEVGEWFQSEFAGEKIPTLKEVLLLVKGKAGVMIEVKEELGREEEIAMRVVRVLEEVGSDPGDFPFYVASLSKKILQLIRQERPSQMLVSVVEDEPSFWNHMSAVFPGVIAFSSEYFSKLPIEFIEQLKVSKRKIWVWVVNDLSTAESFLVKGADGLISDGFTKLIKNGDAFSLAK